MLRKDPRLRQPGFPAAPALEIVVVVNMMVGNRSDPNNHFGFGHLLHHLDRRQSLLPTICN